MSRVPPLPERKDSLIQKPQSPSIPPLPSKNSLSDVRPATTTYRIAITGYKRTDSPRSVTVTRYSPSKELLANISAHRSPHSPRRSYSVPDDTNLKSPDSSSVCSSKRSTCTSKVGRSTRTNKMANSFVFEAPNIQQKNFETMYQFYLSGQLCDVVVQAGSKSIKCHKLVLACISHYFRAMFMSQMSEATSKTVTIQDSNLDKGALEELIKFAYLGKITLTVSNVQQLLYASSILQMEMVAEACCKFMNSHLHPSNCIAVRNFAEQHGRTELIKIVDKYVLGSFLEITEHEDFCNIPFSLLDYLVGSMDLNVNNEAEVYEAVMKWIKHDPLYRKDSLSKIMSKVKLPLLSMEYLIENVKSEEMMRTNLECRDLLDEAKHYQMSLVNIVPDVKITQRMRPRKSYAGVLFCVGGRGVAGDPFRSVETYDIRNDKWVQVSEMSYRRRHVGVCSAGGLIYAVGGHDGKEHLQSAEVFDPNINKWRIIAPMATFRRGLSLACLGGPVYAVGGLDDNTCFATVERYDPLEDAWTYVSSMNTARGGVGIAALKGFLYAVGGNDGGCSLGSCERYDPFLNKWTSVTSMNKRRAGAGLSVLHGCLYAVGGFDDNSPLKSAERYDPQTEKWTAVADLMYPRGGVGLAALGGRVFAVGGHDGTNYLSSVEAYDPEKDSWQTVGDVNIGRAGAGIVFSDCSFDNLTTALQPYVTNCV